MANLSGTRALAKVIDASAHEASSAGQLDLADQVERTVSPLLTADPAATVVTIQGSIRLADRGTNASTPEEGWFMIAGGDPPSAGCGRSPLPTVGPP